MNIEIYCVVVFVNMMDYQVADMTSTSSAYSYYPNYHNHSHMHHHHHMHHNASEVLSNNSLSNNGSVVQLTQANTPTASLYHEYGISMEPAYYEPESAYYGSHTSLSEHVSTSPVAHQTSYPPTPVNSDIHSDSPTSHIISSDNGLCYTNLDYIYGQTHSSPLYLSQQDDKSALSHTFNSATSSGNIDLNSLHQTPQTPLWPSHHSIQTTQSSHETTAYMENSTIQNPQINHSQPLPCTSNQTTLAPIQSDIASDLTNSRNLNRSEIRNSSNSITHLQKSTNQQPTYKWMQVKRNVPKPQGRSTN